MAAKIRVLVVDDSVSVRSAIVAGLSDDPQIEVIGTASDGRQAVEQVQALRPDVVTLDVEMPHLDGLGALEQIMTTYPTPVVMVSSLTRDGAAVTIRALELGAVDFTLKTASRGTSAVRGLITELAEKIRQAATAKVTALTKPAGGQKQGSGTPTRSKDGFWQNRVVVIASSTGGPRALQTVIPSLPADLPAPVLVVQHLPAGFTGRMAESLNKRSPLTVEEARPGLTLDIGRVLIAPGGVHMEISPHRSIRLNLNEQECGVRPSANPTMETAARVCGAATLGVILTGMGVDGTRGAGLIKEAGGDIIAKDEETCVVYGMPKSVAEAGYVDRVVPRSPVASAIVEMCRVLPGRAAGVKV